MQIVTLKKNTLIRHFIFLLILAIGFGTVVISQNAHTETADEYAENGTKNSGRAC